MNTVLGSNIHVVAVGTHISVQGDRPWALAKPRPKPKHETIYFILFYTSQVNKYHRIFGRDVYAKATFTKNTHASLARHAAPHRMLPIPHTFKHFSMFHSFSNLSKYLQTCSPPLRGTSKPPHGRRTARCCHRQLNRTSMKSPKRVWHLA